MPARRPRKTVAEPQPSPQVRGVENTRDHILDRTIFLIGKKGTTDVSVRDIAREAGVNVAAVNYYFSSKEQMYTQMGERFWTGYKQVMGLLSTPGQPAEVRLRRWCQEVMRYLADYPGILALLARQLLAQPNDPFGKVLQQVIAQAYRDVEAVLGEVLGKIDPHALAFKLSMLVSTLAGPLPVDGDGSELRDGLRAPALRERFLDLLMEHLRR
ncbi:MAG TPA: TetR/AcrR family transcriptional regulator [Myxococcota bacterium]|nr:TetR/AcrR family transcriptional regulator [Myxococcota bacterium]HRY96126.1 TetR/AcrR family transcriptional regulator [Myxococcota bacterium]